MKFLGKVLGKVVRGTTDPEIVYTEERIGVISVRKYMPYRGVTGYTHENIPSETREDDSCRAHGGTSTPPSKRPPSEAVRKLHPLMQLDEQIGRDMTKGDQEGPS